MARKSDGSDLGEKRAKSVAGSSALKTRKTGKAPRSLLGSAKVATKVKESKGDRKKAPPKRRRLSRGVIFPKGRFQSYKLKGSLSFQGAEADIYIIEDEEAKNYVLRLYREHVEPSPGILQKLSAIGELLGERVVRTLFFGNDAASGRFYEIQEYVEGGDLDALLKKSKLDPESVRSLADQLSETLGILHSNGLIHRDVKPSNILVRSEAPLKVALGDFGISSILATNVSIKETQMANTPLYAAPESFADFASAAGDFWSLGAVLLECLEGVHPLEGLSVNMVIREICSRGLKTPDNLPPDLERLLKGLLTRDDKRRWRRKEVSALLSGDLSVPVREEEPEPIQADLKLGKPGPLKLDGREFSSVRDLALYFNQGPREWEMGRELLARGVIRSWLIADGRQEDALEMDLKLRGDPEDNVFAFTRVFLPECPPLCRGLPISLENLNHLLKNRNSLDASENMFLSGVLAGKLKNFPRIAASFGAPFPDALAAALSPPAPVSPETLACAMEAFDAKDEYIWGIQGPPNARAEAIAFVLEAGRPLLSWDYFKANVRPGAELPDSYLQSFGNPKTYKKTAEDLVKAINAGEFTTRSAIREKFLLSPA
jgi:serine/threonine protein kinase